MSEQYKHLGEGNSYAVYTDNFDPSLLEKIKRSEQLNERVVGFDAWTCHESTFLLDNGAPIAGTLRFVYPATSSHIVESKSMKLYLNSFDMCKMGQTIYKAIENYCNQIKIDLENLLETEVLVGFFSSYDYENDIKYDPIYYYTDIMELINIENIEINDYNASENHIKFETDEIQDTGSYEEYIHSNILRSRCRHTKQKDTGSALLYYKDYYSLNLESYFKHLVSLREVSDFHEPNCTKIINDILEVNPDIQDVMVQLLYSRRGSLDINPVRATSLELIPDWYTNMTMLVQKTQGQ